MAVWISGCIFYFFQTSHVSASALTVSSPVHIHLDAVCVSVQLLWAAGGCCGAGLEEYSPHWFCPATMEVPKEQNQELIPECFPAGLEGKEAAVSRAWDEGTLSTSAAQPLPVWVQGEAVAVLLIQAGVAFLPWVGSWHWENLNLA